MLRHKKNPPEIITAPRVRPLAITGSQGSHLQQWGAGKAAATQEEATAEATEMAAAAEAAATDEPAEEPAEEPAAAGLTPLRQVR